MGMTFIRPPMQQPELNSFNGPGDKPNILTTSQFELWPAVLKSQQQQLVVLSFWDAAPAETAISLVVQQRWEKVIRRQPMKRQHCEWNIKWRGMPKPRNRKRISISVHSPLSLHFIIIVEWDFGGKESNKWWAIGEKQYLYAKMYSN